MKTVPPNGLALFVGLVDEDDGKMGRSSMVSIGLEPLYPLHRFVYLCDKRFHTEFLREQLDMNATRFGFMIVDGNGANYYAISDVHQELLWSLRDPSLPKKHHKGGQSSNRFARIREEKRDQYVKKLAKNANKVFIESTNTHKVWVSGILVAGFGDVKNQLVECKELDPRIREKVVEVLDIQYGSEIGLREALAKGSTSMKELGYNTERKVASDFMAAVANDGLVCYGHEDTLWAITEGVLETLVVHDSLSLRRVQLKNKSTMAERTLILSSSNDTNGAASTAASASAGFGPKPGAPSSQALEWEVIKDELLIDWLLESTSLNGANLQLVSDETSEGKQFVLGFGGIGGFLRYRIELPSISGPLDADDDLEDIFGGGNNSDSDDIDWDSF